MPFYADTRCSPIRYQFNVSIVIEMLEELIDKFYDSEKEDKKKIELYVEWCENNYDGYSLDEWLRENYCEYTYWEEIEEMFSTEEEKEPEELKCIGFREQTREGECGGCKMVCEECENLMICVKWYEERYKNRLNEKLN